MGKIKALMMIEQEFIDVLEALSPKECKFNYRLLSKTKKVAGLLGRLARARKSFEHENQQEQEIKARGEENREQG
ncbi:MAG: hypothetical protein AB7T49_19850 [Oligoflexales bacterium]|jgi:hypothetical protein